MRPLGKYVDVAKVFQVSKDTIYKWVYLDKFPKNVYVGAGRFNMDKMEYHIEHGTIFSKDPAHKK
jgi:hypothetical protein